MEKGASDGLTPQVNRLSVTSGSFGVLGALLFKFITVFGLIVIEPHICRYSFRKPILFHGGPGLQKSAPR